MECPNNNIHNHCHHDMGEVEKKVLELIRLHAPLPDIIRVVAAGTDEALGYVNDDTIGTSDSQQLIIGIRKCLLRVPLNVRHALDTDMHLYDLLQVMGRSINELTIQVNKALDVVNGIDARINDLDERVKALEGGEADVKVERIELALALGTIYAGSSVLAETNVAATVFPSNAANKNVVWRTSNSDVATISENGVVSAVSGGDVEIICESTDGSGVSASVTVHVIDKAVDNTRYVYGTPTIRFTYPQIVTAGGTVSPNLSYEQTQTAIKTYNDGTEEQEIMPKITSGGEITYSKVSGVATLSDDGKVTYNTANSSTSDETRAKIEVTVTLNGMSNSAEANVIQTKYTMYWYLGQITKTKSEFAALTVDELKGVATAIPTSTTSKNITINKSVWFVMLPDDVEPKSAQYIAGGITSPFSAQEIKDGTGFGCTHSDVTIDGKTYKVYGNRNTALVDSNAAGTFNIN